MAVLSDSDRIGVWAGFMRDPANQPVAVTKADLRAAVNAADAWAEANATSFNTAIPQPARSALTTKQKAALLMYVIRRRYEVA